MKKIILPIVLLLTALLAFDSCSINRSTVSRATTQEDSNSNPPDYKRIKKEINDKNSEYYYPELLRRFEAADTTLTVEQLRYFYYGAATLPNYDPYNKGKTNELNAVLSTDSLTLEHWEQAAEIIEEQLKTTPTHLRFHLYKEIVNINLYGDNSQEAIDAFRQVDMILQAITSTGDGRSEETAFYVTCTTDEYGMMDVLGLQLKSQSLIEKHGQSYDLMEWQDNPYGIEAFYFNITVCMEALSKMFGF